MIQQAFGEFYLYISQSSLYLIISLSVRPQSIDHKSKHLNIILQRHIPGTYSMTTDIYNNFMQIVCYTVIINL